MTFSTIAKHTQKDRHIVLWVCSQAFLYTYAHIYIHIYNYICKYIMCHHIFMYVYVICVNV